MSDPISNTAGRGGKRRACSVVGVQRTIYYGKSRRDNRVLTARIHEIAAARVLYGYRRIYVLLKSGVREVNHTRVYRIYCRQGLNLRSKRPCHRVAAAHRMQRPGVYRVDQCRCMDFVCDNLFNGRRIRALTVVDNFSRECLNLTFCGQGRSLRKLKFQLFYRL